jgi:hypothetical protein
MLKSLSSTFIFKSSVFKVSRQTNFKLIDLLGWLTSPVSNRELRKIVWLCGLTERAERVKARKYISLQAPAIKSFSRKNVF